MAPKKREKDSDASKNPRIDHIQADHELFLQAFESMYCFSKIVFTKIYNDLKMLFSPFQSLHKFTDISEPEICVL